MSDSLLELEVRLPELPAALERQRLGQQLSEATAKLRSGAQEAEKLAALVALAKLLGFDGPEQSAQLDEAREEASRVGHSLATAEDAEALKRAMSRFEHHFVPVMKALYRSLWQHWQSIVARDFTPLVQAGRMLGKLDQGSSLARDLEACGAAAQAMQPGASAPELLARVQLLAERRNRLQDQRRKEFGDGAVAAFVNALAENRARLDMVTPEVRDWLNAHGASAGLRVLAL